MKKNIYYNLPPSDLIDRAVKSNEGKLATNGALVVKTGSQTGRSPLNRFIVDDEITRDTVDWNNINRPIDEKIFNDLYKEASGYLSTNDVFAFNGFVGADKSHRIPIEVVTTKAWHSLFAHTLFVRPSPDELKNHTPQFSLINAFGLKVDTERYGIKNGIFVGISFKQKKVLIIGTGYGGEMKKSIFSVMNCLLPQKGVFPMHCSANIGQNGESALFFGLSGTGKTTLSADPRRSLIGDDEHGWCDNGIFNFEGGCYAKVINLSKESEPQIFNAIKRGSILENVVMRDDGSVDYSDASITENTRATYPVDHIPNAVLNGVGSHPKNIFFLTCDAFGVLPPISKLSAEQAMYHFISGYTAKVAGTEVGIKEPTATFSSCFGAPFMPLSPHVYSKMLGEMITRHKANVWLVNTGWSGGGYGVGHRMKIGITRDLLNSAIDGDFNAVKFENDPIFGLSLPAECAGVPSEILRPRNSWKDKALYDETAKKVLKLFEDNYKKCQ